MRNVTIPVAVVIPVADIDKKLLDAPQPGWDKVHLAGFFVDEEWRTRHKELFFHYLQTITERKSDLLLDLNKRLVAHPVPTELPQFMAEAKTKSNYSRLVITRFASFFT